MGGGLLMTKYYSDQISSKSLLGGGVIYIKALVDFKYAQLGVGTELLIPIGSVELLSHGRNGYRGSATTDVTGVLNMLTLNGKINLKRGNFMYGGVSTGVSIYPGWPLFTYQMGSIADLRMVNGLQVGYALKWGKRVRLNISESWRVQKLGVYSHNDYVPLGGGISNVRAHSFTTTLGVSINK